MKNTSPLTKLIMFLLFAAVAAYFGVQGYRYFVNPTTTTVTYRYRTEDAIELRGYVVRDETVIEGSDTLIELTHTEGERVAALQPLATAYRSEDALRQAQALLNGVPAGSSVILTVGRGKRSQMTGQHRCNLDALREEFSLGSLRVRECEEPAEDIKVEVFDGKEQA